MSETHYKSYVLYCIVVREKPMSVEEFSVWWDALPDHQKVNYVRQWRGT